MAFVGQTWNPAVGTIINNSTISTLVSPLFNKEVGLTTTFQDSHDITNRSLSLFCHYNNSVWLLDHPVCSTRFDSIFVFVMVCFVLAFITLWTAFGNILVLIALYRYSTLRTMSNCLIGNLAISDLLLATTVMPVSICNDVLGYWVFGQQACNLWLMADVFYCTASVWGLCTVAFDRYLATVYPVWYHDQRSVKKALIFIAFVWIFSSVISFAPLIAWRQMIPKFFTFNTMTGSYECVLFMTSSYVIYSATGSFIIPMCLMTFLYMRIFKELHRKSKHLKRRVRRETPPARNKNRRQRSGRRKPTILEPLNGAGDSVVRDFTTTTLMSMTANEIATNSNSDDNHDLNSDGSSKIKPNGDSCITPFLTLNTESPKHNSQKEANQFEKSPEDWENSPAYVSERSSLSSNGISGKYSSALSMASSTKQFNDRLQPDDATVQKQRSKSVSIDLTPTASRSPSITFLNVTDLERRKSHTGSTTQNHLSPNDAHNCNGNHNSSHFQSSGPHRSKSANVLNSSDEDSGHRPSPRAQRRSLPCDLSKFGRNNRMTLSMKRRFELREQRATKRMLLIMACFIVCWMPFVGMYIARSVCTSCSMGIHFVSAIIWLGYVNSSLNPVLYTLFNDDFRSAFHKLLGCKQTRKRKRRRKFR